MKGHPLAQGHLESAVIEPPPRGGQPWHQVAILVELHRVLEDVPGNPRPIEGVWIHNPQVAARCGDLLPKATAPPSEGHEHKDNTPKGQLSHGNPSLTAVSEPDDLSPHEGRILVE